MLSVSGCRGIVGTSLTPEVICRFAAASAAWVREARGVSHPKFILACDGRRGGSLLKQFAGAALAACGCQAIDIGIATTPTVGIMVDSEHADAGLTLTASHNPAQWNGIKVIDGTGAAPTAAESARIIDLFRQTAPCWKTADDFGSVRIDDSAFIVHLQRVLSAMQGKFDLDRIRARRFSVVLDSVNASGARVGRALLEELGCRITHLNADDSGIFPHPPEPTETNLRPVAAEAARLGSDVSFAQDPDADRLAILDESGAYIGEEYTLVLGVMALLGAMKPEERSGAVVVANLSTSRMIDDVAARYGASVRRSAVGEANVVAVMRSAGAILGGEGNGGVIWPEVVSIRDSVSAMALVLALMEREGKPLSQIIRTIPTYAIEKRKIELKPGLTERALAAAARLADAPGATIDRQDGVRIDFPAASGRGLAWLHVRSSNTEPIVRLIAEAPTTAEASAVLDRALEEIDRA